MATLQDLVAACRREEVTYQPSGRDNFTKYGREFGADGQPWCVMFCYVVAGYAGVTLPYKTAGVVDLASWASKNRRKRAPDAIQPGMMVAFDWTLTRTGVAPVETHIGWCVERFGRTITTVEGNVGNRDEVVSRTYGVNDRAVWLGVDFTDLFPAGNRFLRYPNLARGAKDHSSTGIFPDPGSPVQTLQNALNIVTGREGNNPDRLSPDGDFGPLTERAVRDFQDFFKVPEIGGTVGANTWEVLDYVLDLKGR
ncbi:MULTISPECIES: peptidoglycan-binding protein [Protofrankia]|uniref:Peptidoglycan-binding domain 1 protein n=1 Tax=Candidatus Protofrankia datiscae TaxID=2716812 RepID=F8AWX2_9ACTN|nr:MULTISPECIES: peptidoglycan-binding protein [Protofrankia]AEH11416.1 Peptidoglycan-binding domain 1 protein [Candidatus Protofrankia datiscae]